MDPELAGAADPDALGRLLGVAVRTVRTLDDDGTRRIVRAGLADGRSVFAKIATHRTPAGYLAAEAQGLAWLAGAAGGPAVPGVLGHSDRALALPWLPSSQPRPDIAEEFGRKLARMHAAGTGGQFGAPWTGYVGSAPMDNGPAASWPEFYANRRLTPYVRQLRDRGALTGADAAVFDHLTSQLPTVTGPPEEPARLHGDLWNGNLLWGADGAVWLVDPAAHGGHRETDLAMLQLFGVPFRTRIIAGYRESATDLGRPLADGWEERIAVHQLFPLLVHAVLFGGGYLRQALAVARRYSR